MPNLTIQGKKINRVLDAHVEITHGDAAEAKQIPILQFIINLPLNTTDHRRVGTCPARPQAVENREIESTDLSKVVNPPGRCTRRTSIPTSSASSRPRSASSTDQGNYIQLILRGTLQHNNVDYDGKNILSVAAGAPEPAAE